MPSRPTLTSTQRRLVAVVAGGAALIAGIGFVGSYAAVRKLAEEQQFGTFALVFPIGIDVGIVVLLCLDMVLSWLRMPFPLLRHTAWLLTAATIAFNGATAWPDPLGVGMHAVIPLLFVVVVEAARSAVGRIADITVDRHVEPVRLSRWLLSPLPTFKLWRRMKLWEMRSYRTAVRFEQDRLVYQAKLEAEYGRHWRRQAPVEMLLPLRLMRYGVPLEQDEPEPAEDAEGALTFEAAAAEAIALAPPAALDPAAPQPEPHHPATPATAPVAAPATPAAPPDPTNAVPPGTILLPLTCRAQHLARTTAAPPLVAARATPSRPAAQHPEAAAANAAPDPATPPDAEGCGTPAPLTVGDVASRFSVTPATVRSWVTRGKLTPLPRPGGNTRGRPLTFDPAAVAALDAPAAAPATPPHPDHMEGGYA